MVSGSGGTRRVEVKSIVKFVDTAFVEVIEGVGEGARVHVTHEPVIVGRAPGCHLVLADARVSTTHLELRGTDHGVEIRDLATTNGTWVGTLRLGSAVALDGTEIRIGGSTLRITYDDAPTKIAQSRAGRLHGLVGASAPMRALYAQIAHIAPTALSVLVEAETGSGKEEVARALHLSSKRASGPFVVVDCGAIAPTLLESTLFGHEKGSFSGATERRVGLVEAAEGGTLFLDELGELPLEAQTRLLRLIEARTFRRVGATKDLKADVRFVSATHRDLPSMVAAGTFRSDLFFRLATARVRVPPLRERPEDIPELIAALARRLDVEAPRVDGDALAALSRRGWAGNVRELRNLVEVWSAMAPRGRVGLAELHALPSEGPPTPVPTAVRSEEPRAASKTTKKGDAHPSQRGELGLFREDKDLANDAFEREYLTRLVELHPGNLSHQAAHAGLVRHHLRALLKKHGIPRE